MQGTAALETPSLLQQQQLASPPNPPVHAVQTAQVSLHAHGSSLLATEFTVTHRALQMRKYAAIRAMHGTLCSVYL